MAATPSMWSWRRWDRSGVSLWASPPPRLFFSITIGTFLGVLSARKAGKATDAVIDGLVPLLEKNDIIIDGGNALWTDTIRREKALREKGLRFIGSGVSGGEEGALHGPSIMVGGSEHAYAHLGPVVETIAAQVDGVPCDFIFVGACNIQDLPHLLSPLRSRITGGGYEVLVETTMEDSPAHRAKLAQFVADGIASLEALGLRSRIGDDHLRLGYLKAFMDGTLGSRTASLLDGSGIRITSGEELAEVVRARGGLAVGAHRLPRFGESDGVGHGNAVFKDAR